MAYQFLIDEDFDANIKSTLLRDPSAQNLTDILEDLEKRALAILKTKLAGRYDVETIFTDTDPDRHYLMVHYATTIVVYLFVKRNAARKVPTNFKEDYDAVMKDLEKIQAGRMVPDGLTKPTDDEGDIIKPVIMGNRKNTDFFI